ncbi:unnamed protein product, partial [Heterosigma akashiwo]
GSSSPASSPCCSTRAPRWAGTRGCRTGPTTTASRPPWAWACTPPWRSPRRWLPSSASCASRSPAS